MVWVVIQVVVQVVVEVAVQWGERGVVVWGVGMEYVACWVGVGQVGAVDQRSAGLEPVRQVVVLGDRGRIVRAPLSVWVCGDEGITAGFHA